MLADHFASVSGPENYTPAFQRYRLQEERKRLNFETPHHFPYNDPLTMRELFTTLSSAGKSSPGEDMITYSVIKKMVIPRF